MQYELLAYNATYNTPDFIQKARTRIKHAMRHFVGKYTK